MKPAIPVLILAATIGLGAASPSFTTRSSDFVRRGRAEFAAGHIQVAVKSLERAIVADPMNVDAYAALARAYQSVGRTDRAEKYFGIALEIDPTDRGALEGDGLLALKSGRRSAAEQDLGRLKTLCAACEETRRLTEAIVQDDAGKDEAAK